MRRRAGVTRRSPHPSRHRGRRLRWARPRPRSRWPRPSWSAGPCAAAAARRGRVEAAAPVRRRVRTAVSTLPSVGADAERGGRTLTAGDAEVTVQPGNGGRVAGLGSAASRCCGRAAVRVLPDSALVRPDRRRTVPGRRRRAADAAQLPAARHPRHRPGRRLAHRPHVGDEAVLTYDLVDPWPYAGRVTQDRRAHRGRPR